MMMILMPMPILIITQMNREIALIKEKNPEDLDTGEYQEMETNGRF
jgi:hypothetical protein